MQSPIALSRSQATPSLTLASTSYHHMSSVTVTDAGHTASASATPGGVLDLDGKQYTLEEIHCHSPSEHTIEGHRADLEAHLVHRSREGEIAVIGHLFDKAPGSHPVDAYIVDTGGLPSTHHLGTLFTDSSGPVFRYTGSLTTPPYSEDVQWVVHASVGRVGEDALAEFADRYRPNNRELQQAHDAEVTFG